MARIGFTSLLENSTELATNVRNEIGNSVYVGTLFLDVRMKRLEQIFRSVRFNGAEEIYIVRYFSPCRICRRLS